MSDVNRDKNGNIFKRTAFKVLTPKILKPRPSGQGSKELMSVPGFIREKIIMRMAREGGRRAQKARKLGISPDQLPLTDPIWRKYQNLSISLEDFDISGCERDENLFDLGKEFVEHVHAAEIGPDDGISINDKVTLPRSFLLDSIHLAASQHCIYLQKKLGKPFQRSECPSPDERAKTFDGISEYYKPSIKNMTGKLKRRWSNFGIDKAQTDPTSDNEEGDDLSDGEEANNETEVNNTSSTTERSHTDPDFDIILAHLLDTPYSLDPLPSAYEYADSNDFGADVLWSFDTSSLLAFGVMAEEFISRMIDINLEKQKEVTTGATDSTEPIVFAETGVRDTVNQESELGGLEDLLNQESEEDENLLE